MCENAETSHEDFVNPLTKASEFKCDKVGRFIYSGSCEKYYFCWDAFHEHAIFTCPDNRAFDPITRRCVYNFAVCASAPKCKPGKRILPNPNDKFTFFKCKFRYLSKKIVLRKQDCADGREFNADLGYCKSIFDYDSISSDSGDSSENVECEKPGLFIDYLDHSKCYECIVKSVSKGSLKLIRHECHKFKIYKNHGASLHFTCFISYLLSFFVHVIIKMQS